MKRLLFFITILSICFIGPVFAASEFRRNLGAEDYIGGDEESREPIYKDFLKFDQLYATRQRGQNITASQWLKLGKEFDKYNKLMEAPGHLPNKAYFLRGMLIRGECYLLASIEYYKLNPKGMEFHEAYEEGIKQLRQVLVKADEKIDYLPRFSLMSTEKEQRGYFDLDPRAGYETIGTGIKVDLFLPDSDLIPNRKVTYKVERFADVSLLRKFIERYLGELGPTGREKTAKKAYRLKEAPNSLLAQVRTSEKARQLLSDFCPWGVDLFWFLRDDAMLTGSLNFSILKPYALKGQEFLSEGALRGDPPVSMDKELCAIIGSGTNLSGRENRSKNIHWIKDSTGVVKYSSGRQEGIKWSMIQERPSYTIWYMSPACYDMKLSEKISYAVKGFKLFTVGPIGLIADEFIGYLMDMYGELAGKDGFIYGVTNTAVEGNNWGVVQDEFLFKGEIAERKVVSQILINGFKKLEEQEKEWLFEDIDPKMSLMGKGYLGETIPPIIIRSEVFGYEKVKPHKYVRSRRFLRYYQLDPAYLGGVKAYDLRFKPITIAQRDGYRTRDLKVHGGAWKIMPNLPDKPLGRRQFITDHTPKCQILDLSFTPEEFSAWEAETSTFTFWKGLEAVLYSPLDTGFKKPLAKQDLEKAQTIFQIVNQDLPENADKSFGVYTTPSLEAVKFKSEIFTDYVLRVELGDKILKKMPIVFAARKNRPASGRRTELKCGNIVIPGYVVMKVEPKKKSELDAYTICHIRFGLRMNFKDKDPRKMKEADKIRHRFFKDELLVKGKFDGDIFTGKLLTMRKHEGIVKFRVDPETMEISGFELNGKWIRNPGRKYSTECNLNIKTTGSRTLKEVKESYGPEKFEIHLKGEEVCAFAKFNFTEKSQQQRDSGRIVLGFDCKEHDGVMSSLYGQKPSGAYLIISIRK